MGSRARSEEAAAGLSATVDECRVREAGDKPDRSFISRVKIACVFNAAKRVFILPRWGVKKRKLIVWPPKKIF